jgi:hypothetical protein
MAEMGATMQLEVIDGYCARQVETYEMENRNRKLQHHNIYEYTCTLLYTLS